MQLNSCPTGLQAGQSRRFAIREFILNLLKSDERLSLYKIVKNPKNPTALDDGLTIVFVDVSDGYISESSNDRSRRLYSFSLAVVSRSSEDAEAEAEVGGGVNTAVRRGQPALNPKFPVQALSERMLRRR